MPDLNLMINGDCASAVTALSMTERAVGSLQRSARGGVGVAVSVVGARAAARDLTTVGGAITATSAAAAAMNRAGPIGGGFIAAAGAARGLTSTLSGTSRAISETRAGVGALAVANSGAARQMGAVLPVVAGMTSRIGALNTAAARAAAMPAPIPGGRRGGASIAAVTHGVEGLRSALAAQQAQQARGLPVMAMANGQMRAMAANATTAAGAMTRLQARDPLNGRFIDQNPGYLGSIRQGWREGVARGRALRDNPPPIVPTPPGGGGGGGGGEDPDGERTGAAAGKAVVDIGKGLGTMLMAGLAVGIATNSSYAKHGLDAVNATISETPGLADKAEEAADELGAGLRDITEGVNMDRFADQFERLGTANRALGQVQGQIGMQNLAVKLDTEAKAADAQTRALVRMAPAFDAAIRGSHNLETALLRGISNPQVVNGVRALGESLSKPEIAKGLADITTGATGAALVWGKVAADISGAASSVANSLFGGQAVTDASSTLFGGAAAMALAKGGMGSRIGAGILGASAVGGSQHLMATGQDDLVLPSIVNQILGAAIGYRLGGVGGMVAGGLVGQYGTMGLGQLPGEWGKMGPGALTGVGAGATIGMIGGPVGMAIGGLVGGVVGAAAARGPRRENDNLLAGITGPKTIPKEQPTTNVFTGKPLESRPVTDLWTGKTTTGDPGTGGLFGSTPPEGAVNQITGRPVTGPGSIGGPPALGEEGPVEPGPQQPEAPKSQGEQLQERQKATQQRVAEERRQRGLRPVGGGAAPPAPITAAPASAVQNLDQSAQRATQSIQGLGQAMPQVAQQAQQLPAAMTPVRDTVANYPAQAQAQMQTAANVINTSAQQVGTAIPPAVSTGIVKQTPQVCNAAADMGSSMVDCTARALRSASPSKKFIELGESTGDGAKIGVDNSAPGAVNAIGDMASGMLAQVGGFGSGVEAATAGAVPIASAAGLMVGYTWARSVATGADTVIRNADFTQASLPAINSALAETALGQMGFLGIAGSGASMGKGANGGFLNFPSVTPVINATVQVSVDGTPLDVKMQRVVDVSMEALADAYSRQKG